MTGAKPKRTAAETDWLRDAERSRGRPLTPEEEEESLRFARTYGEI